MSFCVLQLIMSGLSLAGSLYIMYALIQQMDPTRASRKQIAFARKQLKKRLGRDISLSNTETVRSSHLIYMRTTVGLSCCLLAICAISEYPPNRCCMIPLPCRFIEMSSAEGSSSDSMWQLRVMTLLCPSISANLPELAMRSIRLYRLCDDADWKRSHSQVIANDIVTPADVNVLLKDIGGLQDIIARLVRMRANV